MLGANLQKTEAESIQVQDEIETTGCPATSMRGGDVKEGSRLAATKQEVGARVVRDDVEEEEQEEEEQKPEDGRACTRMSRASLSSRSWPRSDGRERGCGRLTGHSPRSVTCLVTGSV
ncbi:uncharacterized protein UTRI_01830 [Ustilago trichophora]|uniref:Uncharacterized protein n=1 Tax=Ustilago trichophora TaxID=86804 RepID=A0A5C3DY42_9BASI|nr:uncharacterized protein UTRI_01830 [Ustilago trichophora]